MVTCQSSELGWEVTVELPTDFLSLGRGSVTIYLECAEGDSLYKYILDLTLNCRPGNIVSHNIP